MQPALSNKSPTDETYSGLESAYDHFNKALFDNTLSPCLFTLQRRKGVMGYHWKGKFINPATGEKTDEVAFNPVYYAPYPILEFLQTVVHEMCHLWQGDFGKPSRGGYHNKEWADKMEAVGLMPSSTGKPGGKKTGQKIADYAIEGGPFSKAANELLDSGFRLHWVDVEGLRMPPQSGDALGVELAQSEGAAELIGPAPDKPKNKTKYQHRCLSGDEPETVNVWGKPNLSLACGNCGELFVSFGGDIVQSEQP